MNLRIPALMMTLLLAACNGGEAFLILRPQIRFDAAALPAPQTVTLQEDMPSSSPLGGSIFVDVVISDTANVFAISFDLLYNSELFTFVNILEGSFLNQSGIEDTTLAFADVFDTPIQNRLIVALTRQGVTSPDIDAVGDQVLMILEFQTKTLEPATAPVTFDTTILQPCVTCVTSATQSEVIGPSGFSGGALRVELIP